MGVLLYNAAVLADTPIAFWKFDDTSGLPQDSSGNGLHMTSIAGPAAYHAAGPFTGAYAINFGGSQATSRASVSTQIDNITYEGWVNFDTVANDNQQFFGNDPPGWIIVMRVTRQFQVWSGGLMDNSAAALTLNVWYHVVCRRQSGTWSYWINGAVDDANAGSGAPGSPASATTVHGGTALGGFYSNVAYYTTALSDARIAAHYAAAQAVDPDPNSFLAPHLSVTTTA